MRALIDDLLAYSRIDTQGNEPTVVDMNLVMATVLETLKTAIEESGAEVMMQPLPTIVGNEAQMVQVMQNLVANAIKFHGKERPKIEVWASDEGRNWVFAVKDNGIGLNTKYADRIFEMFQRLHTKEEYPGTGVGLAIAKKIVELHGGRIWVESDLGKGATFFFTIPKGGGGI
jgi:chemotaxis family two-component system sensor kinase Cph1